MNTLNTMPADVPASLARVEDEPEIIAARQRCAAIAARRDQLAAEVERIAEQLRAMENGANDTGDADAAALDRLLRADAPAVDPKYNDLQERHRACLRDWQMLGLYLGRAQNRVQQVRVESARARIRQPDFVAALADIAAAGRQLSAANAAMGRLLVDVVRGEGRSELLGSEFSGLVLTVLSAGRTAEWQASAERLCGAPLHEPSACVATTEAAGAS